MSKNYHLKRYAEFSDPLVHKSLKETSKDSSKSPEEFMTANKISVIDFDQVKNKYLKERSLYEDNAKSVDALYMLNNEVLCFTEFKNGDFKASEIIEKSLSSVLMFCDITSKDLSYMRENAVFVLVYNGEEKKLETRQIMTKKKAHRAKDKYSLFGLEHLDGFCFKSIVEIEKSEFDESIYSKGIATY